MSDATAFLMYHELRRADAPLSSSDPGYARYAVSDENFRAQLGHMRERGLVGQSVSQWLDANDRAQQPVVITFDDGAATDLTIAAPLLRAMAWSATCYLTVDFLDTPGFLSRAQARELAQGGIEIGCHSMSHAFLNDVSDEQLHREVVLAKLELEQICGVSVRSFSCPGGRFDHRLMPLALSAGYDSVTCSRPERNAARTMQEPFGRHAMMHDTTLAQLDDIIDGRESMNRRVRTMALAAAKTLLGNSLYVKLRSRLLGGNR